MKRHFESLHAKDFTEAARTVTSIHPNLNFREDHISHLIWGFMAITHVLTVFPLRNDLINYEHLRISNLTVEEQKPAHQESDAPPEGGAATAQ
jgi:hypothetical protein